MSSAELLSDEELRTLLETGRPDHSDIEDEVLETAGLTSKVWDTDEDGELTIVGHVLLEDYDDDISFPRDDDEDLSRRELIVREARDLEGVTALFESSSGSYHLWNLSVERLSSRVLRGLALHGDPMHIAVSWRRSMFVLRTAPKVYSRSLEDEDGEPRIYKPAPTLVDVFTTETDLPQSRPHFEFLRSLAEIQDREELVEEALEADEPDPFRWTGLADRVDVSRYMTVTDELKREVW